MPSSLPRLLPSSRPGDVRDSTRAKVLGTAMLHGGSASYSTSALVVGTNGVKAVYAGDLNFAASTSKAVQQVVDKATTAVTLTSSQNPSTTGQAVMFTAIVTTPFGNLPTGTVTFYDGSMALKSAGLISGQATFTSSKLIKGTHTITAKFSGGWNFSPSAAALSQSVN